MIKLRGLSKQYKTKGAGNNTRAVNGIDLNVPEGKLTTLLGPSGCGKTTTLRMIAGLEKPDEGEIAIGDTTVYSSEQRVFVGAHRRSIGFVFQSYAIWPHLTVLQNVMFPLRVGRPKVARDEARRRALEALDLVQLADFASRPAPALSGGQQQRVALARAVVREPKVLLLDEPLSNLDAALRDEMRVQIRALQNRLGITTILVTHDQNEALAISDEIVLMNQGTIVERGVPETVYSQPGDEFTARFLGVSNALSGVVEAAGEQTTVRVPGGLLRCSGHEAVAAGDRVSVFLRPEGFTLARVRSSDFAWSGTVEISIFRGDSWEHHVRVGDELIKTRVFQEGLHLSVGDEVFVQPDDSAILMPSPGVPAQPTEKSAPVPS